MLEFIRKYRFRLVGGVALFAALILFSLNLRHTQKSNVLERGIDSVFAPAGTAGSAASSVLRRAWSDYIALIDIAKENRRLRETVKAQNVRLVRANEAILENDRLRALLGMKPGLSLSSVGASVIGEDSTPWFRTVVIDKGERDGLREGMPAVAVTGVVGQVVKTGPVTSRVLLVTDHASAVAAVVQRSRARGVLRGKGGDLCSLEFTSREDDVKVGDQVMTSGVGGIFPKGVPLGEVTMVKKGEYGIFQTITVRPAVNLSRVEELLVLLRKDND